MRIARTILTPPSSLIQSPTRFRTLAGTRELDPKEFKLVHCSIRYTTSAKDLILMRKEAKRATLSECQTAAAVRGTSLATRRRPCGKQGRDAIQWVKIMKQNGEKKTVK